MIEDPTRSRQASGPLSAGAITRGPTLEASPALHGSGVEGGYAPDDLRSAYELSSQTAGSGQTVAIVDAYDDPDAEADMNAYRSHYGIGGCTEGSGCFRKVDETGGRSYPKPEALWAKEISLDLDMVSAICPNCHILLVETTENTSGDFAAAEDEAVALGATEISNSFSIPSSSEPPGIAAAYNHPGVPITAAGGDDGYAAGVESPAADPGVIAVGGTTLLPANNSRGWSESVWFDESSNELVGTGSGCSSEPKPAWQRDSGCPYRTTNDVAAVADPNTPVSVYDSYDSSQHWHLLGGTSAAAPIVAAAMALADGYTRSFAGAKALYLQELLRPWGFNDITSGSNGSCGSYLCEAEPGYDGPTGLGSLHGTPELPPPTAATARAHEVTRTTAILKGAVETNDGEIEGCTFEYGMSSAYGASAPCSPTPASETGSAIVAANVVGLKAGTGYHYRISLAYRGGPANGGDVTFTTESVTPEAVTEAATAVTQSSATLTGSVDPDGESLSSCEFEYGLSTSAKYESSVPCTSLPGSGDSAVAVSAGLSGLTAGAGYHYRLLASSAAGTSFGADETLRLLPATPTVVTEPPSEVSESSATLNASVDPNGGTVTSCEFQYGVGGGLEDSAPCSPAPVGEASSAPVAATASGLVAGTAYSYRVVASNAGGTAYGDVQTLMTPSSPTSTPLKGLPGGPLVVETPQGGGAPGPSPAAEARLASTNLRAGSGGAVSVLLRCDSPRTSCTGAITLRTLYEVRAAAAGGGRIITLAAGAFTVAGGEVAAVRLRLSAGARALLARSHLLRARAIIALGRAHTDAIVTLRASRHPARA